MSVPAEDVPFFMKHAETGHYLGIEDSASYAGAKVILVAAPDASAPKWLLQNYQNSIYLLNASRTTMCLNVAYESNAAGAPLQQWDCNAGESELWIFIPDLTGCFTLINKKSGLAAGAANSSSGSAVVQLATNDPMTRWSIQTVEPKASPLSIEPIDTGRAAFAETCADEMIYNIYPPIFSPSGTLAAITQDLPRIASFGFSTVLLMPIHPIGVPTGGRPACGSPYAVADFYAIEPALGQLSDFAALVSQAHMLGVKIIMDVVLNHTAWNNDLITEHPEWYVHTDGNKSDTKTIAQAFCFTDVAQLDFKSGDAVQIYMANMLVWWTKNYDVDGFRFDTADNPCGKHRMIPASTWSQIGTRLKAVKPKVILLGECTNPELSLRPFNIDYTNYSLQPAVATAARTQNAGNLAKLHRQLKAEHPDNMLHTAIMQTWDMDLDLKMYGGTGGTLAAATFNFTIEGVPLLFAGEEACNDQSAVNTHTPINWNSTLASWFTPYYQGLCMLRRNHEALRRGRTNWLKHGGGVGLVAFTRSGDSEQALVAINFSAQMVRGSAAGLSSHDWTEVTPPGAPHARVHVRPPAIVLAPWDVAVFIRDAPKPEQGAQVRRKLGDLFKGRG